MPSDMSTTTRPFFGSSNNSQRYATASAVQILASQDPCHANCPGCVAGDVSQIGMPEVGCRSPSGLPTPSQLERSAQVLIAIQLERIYPIFVLATFLPGLAAPLFDKFGVALISIPAKGAIAIHKIHRP